MLSEVYGWFTDRAIHIHSGQTDKAAQISMVLLKHIKEISVETRVPIDY
jgi:hypothetical protein